jgi:alanine racemase
MISSSLTRVEISKKALVNNLQQVKKITGKRTKIMAVVKANAYGHGTGEVAQVVKNQVDWFGVNSWEGGIFLRELKINQPILVLGYLPLTKIKEAIKNDLSFVVYNQETVKKANQEAKKLNKPAKVHLKVETGTHRQGIELEQIVSFAQFCLKQKKIFLEGLYTHYANIEDTLNPSFALRQLATFHQAVNLLAKAKIKIPVKHTACTAATILFAKTHFNLVRLGIGLYGLWPSRETKISAQAKGMKVSLQPALTWKTKVAQIKMVAKGETISYGRTFRTNRRTKIAVLPVGYWDGYDRKLSNSGRVLIKGQFAPVVGRVCMNMMMADVTDIPGVKVEDEVVLLGKQGRNEITAEELAAKIGTINYEMVTRINPWLPRKVV